MNVAKHMKCWVNILHRFSNSLRPTVALAHVDIPHSMRWGVGHHYVHPLLHVGHVLLHLFLKVSLVCPPVNFKRVQSERRSKNSQTLKKEIFIQSILKNIYYFYVNCFIFEYYCIFKSSFYLI